MEYIREAFDTNWVTPLGPNVDGFENDIKDWLIRQGGEEKQITALASGTSAIHLALVLLGIGKAAGDTIDAVVSCQRGMGAAVVRALASALTEDMVRLTVADQNTRAVRLYERLGFVPVEELSRWYRVL